MLELWSPSMENHGPRGFQISKETWEQRSVMITGLISIATVQQQIDGNKRWSERPSFPLHLTCERQWSPLALGNPLASRNIQEGEYSRWPPENTGFPAMLNLSQPQTTSWKIRERTLFVPNAQGLYLEWNGECWEPWDKGLQSSGIRNLCRVLLVTRLTFRLVSGWGHPVTLCRSPTAWTKLWHLTCYTGSDT